MTGDARFLRCDESPLSTMFCSRGDVLKRLPSGLRDHALAESDGGMSVSLFLGRLWAKFGPPDESDDGFTYRVHDTQTGETFRAYSGPSGPSYGAYPEDREQTMKTLVAFETWICQGAPAECLFEYVYDEVGTMRVGIREGKPFEENIAPPRYGPLLEKARSVKECFEMLEQGYPGQPLQGFFVAFSITLGPMLRALRTDFEMFGVDWKARCITANDSRGNRIPLDGIDLPPLKGAAAHWMKAYRKWRSELS